MLTNPKNACTKVAPPPTIPISQYRWIALIPRTKLDDMCDFDLKVNFYTRSFLFLHLIVSLGSQCTKCEF